MTPRAFAQRLSRVELSDRAFNQYAPSAGAAGRASRIRRSNLELYLAEMSARKPGLLLIGEAPSHRGARLTGIPFLSESLLLSGVEGCGMFGASRGYRKSDETEKPSTEASATIVWATIREIRPIPLLWNAFPFHPFERGNEKSNRMPTTAELQTGEMFVEMLIEMFRIHSVVAIGRRAEASLRNLGLDHETVRHPSQGGKPLFVKGLNEILAARFTGR